MASIIEDVARKVKEAIDEAYSTCVDAPDEYEVGCGYSEIDLPSLSNDGLKMLDYALRCWDVNFWLSDEPHMKSGANYTLWIAASVSPFGGDPHVIWGLRIGKNK